MPPGAPGPKPPNEKLAAGGFERAKVTTGEVDRHHAGRDALNPVDPQAMADGRDHRLHEPVGGNGPECKHVESDPVDPLDAPVREDASHAQLVGNGHENRRIAEQVHEVPPLVAEPATHRHQGGDDHDNQQAEPDEGQRHIGNGKERADLGERVDAGAQAISGEEKNGMTDEQVEGGLT